MGAWAVSFRARGRSLSGGGARRLVVRWHARNEHDTAFARRVDSRACSLRIGAGPRAFFAPQSLTRRCRASLATALQGGALATQTFLNFVENNSCIRV